MVQENGDVVYLGRVFFNLVIFVEGNFLRNRNKVIDSCYGKTAHLYKGVLAIGNRNSPSTAG